MAVVAGVVPPAFAGSWSIAWITNPATGSRSAAIGGGMTSGCPTSSRNSPARLAAGKALISVRISAGKKRPDARLVKR
jgi:hypothetical protein